MSYQLPLLPYDYNALEPFIDARTMELHYNKYHQEYVDNLNAALDNLAFVSYSLANVFHFASAFPDAIRNNAAGHYNHSLFWDILVPGGAPEPTGETAKALNQTFGSFDTFKQEFAVSAAAHFGSGWVWLVVTDNNGLTITSTPNQDNPLMDTTAIRGTPILCLDLWEHAYYLNYQDNRSDYLNAFWNVVNWDKVEKLYRQTLTMKTPAL